MWHLILIAVTNVVFYCLISIIRNILTGLKYSFYSCLMRCYYFNNVTNETIHVCLDAYCSLCQCLCGGCKMSLLTLLLCSYIFRNRSSCTEIAELKLLTAHYRPRTCHLDPQQRHIVHNRTQNSQSNLLWCHTLPCPILQQSIQWRPSVSLLCKVAVFIFS